MLHFLFGKLFVGRAQKFIDKLNPRVSAHLPPDLPIPSISLIKKMSVIAAQVNGLEETVSKLSDEQLRAKSDEFKEKYHKDVGEVKERLRSLREQYSNATSNQEREGLDAEITRAKEEFDKLKRKSLDELLPEAFAVVRETAKRRIGLRHYDIQLIGGMILHKGMVTEMATGEGKTLVATLPAYLNALTGDGVHIVTVNDYLARRDRDWMGPVFEALGLTVGVILHDMSPQQRQFAYGYDITYGTNNEFGFDYLRDNMVGNKEDMVQRPHHYAVVDEVDSILIDEARTPLIISGPAEESTNKYYTANEISKKLSGRRLTEKEIIDAKFEGITIEDLSKDYDYIADEKARSISLTDSGEEKAAAAFGVGNLHDMDTIEYRHHILQALKAKEFFKLDVDYVVRDGQVIIVDEFTGRMMPGRRWSDGLHQAVEAKEGIKIERENQTLATITFQNYFRMYDKLSGMTGTAHTEATEFEQIYEVETVVMPTNRPLKRINYPDSIYRTAKEKYAAAVEQIAECYERGQPVLVGTISIEKSEYLSTLLRQRGITHEVLNAKYHEREAQIVAQAGRYKAVTIATNMAGRGTDIVLGGNAEFLARTLADEEAGDNEDPREKEKMITQFLEKFRQQVKEEHQKVVDAGGLYVMGTERHESRRIDNQLRGRSGRQGDPGASKFFISLEDDLMRLFGENLAAMWDKLGVEEGQVIEHPLVTRAIGVAQKRVETHNFEIRKQLLEFDNVMNKQREAIYGLRKGILESPNVKDRIVEAVEQTCDMLIEQYLANANTEMEWDIEGLRVYLKTKFNYDITPLLDDLPSMSADEIHREFVDGLLKVYDAREQEITSEHLRQLEKIVLLNTIDAKWKEHLYAMDQLKEGVGLRAYAQRDPVIEYKKEGYHMFRMMFDSISQEVAQIIFRLRPAEGMPVRRRSVFSDLPQETVHNEFTSLGGGQPQAAPQGAQRTQPPSPAAKPAPVTAGKKVGRNDPCPCGSGKKYKKCCGR